MESTSFIDLCDFIINRSATHFCDNITYKEKMLLFDNSMAEKNFPKRKKGR